MKSDWAHLTLRIALGIILSAVSCTLAVGDTHSSETMPPTSISTSTPTSLSSVASSLTSAPSAQPAQIDFANMRDPFRRVSIKVEHLKPKSELESYSLDSLKVVGVLTGLNRLRALVLTPDGKTYIVAEKYRIGQHGGIVQKITSNGIQVREKVVNVIGQEENVDTEIQMPSEVKRRSPSDSSKEALKSSVMEEGKKSLEEKAPEASGAQ